jgi:2'-5' RNA ligase
MMHADTPDSLQLFYALWPDDATRAALQQLQATLPGNQTPYGNLHLTLAFLGQQPAGLLPVLQAVPARLSRLDITLVLDRIGYFTQKRIAWAGMHQVPDTLSMMQRQLTQMLQQQNVAFDNPSVFKPHVTLARNAPAPPDIPFEPIRWRADQVVLVQSSAQSGGVFYRVLASHRLNSDS